MKITRILGGRTLAAASVLSALALAGCTTYVQQPGPRVTYVPSPPPPPSPPAYVPPPPPVAEVVINSPGDFYQPLTPYGQWVAVGSYGRCWRPLSVEVGWRPYAHGHWRRTDAGWYWVSDEPFGWATYHYGRWGFDAGVGWFWVPQTQWAPSWVSWHEGGGYVGWAALRPVDTFGGGGVLAIGVGVPLASAFVFVEERRFLDPIRPAIMINDATLIRRTANITNLRMVNNAVVVEGPRTEVIERATGQKLLPVAARDLRRQAEAPAKARQRSAGTAQSQQRNASPQTTGAGLKPERKPEAGVSSPEKRPENVKATQANTPPTPKDKLKQAGGPDRNAKPGVNEPQKSASGVKPRATGAASDNPANASAKNSAKESKSASKSATRPDAKQGTKQAGVQAGAGAKQDQRQMKTAAEKQSPGKGAAGAKQGTEEKKKDEGTPTQQRNP